MGTASATLEVLTQLSSLSVAGACFLLWLIYLVSLAIYRLYLSPLAKFPGPKLAALSKYYEFYYEVVKRGQFTFHVQELHKKYGETCPPTCTLSRLIAKVQLFALLLLNFMFRIALFGTLFTFAQKPIGMHG
jgi:hypothetical protein